MSRRGRAGVGPWVLVLASTLPAGTASARIVRVDGPRGPVWTNVPEPAASVPARLTERRRPYLPLIRSAARRHGVSPSLVEAIVACESNFDPEAVSRAGACGLMQLMPTTAALHGLEDPFDPAGNLDAGTRHLAALLERFDGERRLAVAAYNAGEGAVERAGGVPPYRETRAYVRKVEAYLALLGDGDGLPSRTPVRSRPARTNPIRTYRTPDGRLVWTNLPPGEVGEGRR